MPELLAYSVPDAAKALSLSYSQVKELVREGRLKVVRVGRRVLVPRWAMDEFLGQPTPSPQEWDALLREL